MTTYSPALIDYAASRGIAADELPLICDGCSGGLSWLYALAGRHISCEDCCNVHDIDYQLGGGKHDRREADARLRDCAAKGGGFRPCRAFVMWAGVRLCGWAYWAKP